MSMLEWILLELCKVSLLYNIIGFVKNVLILWIVAKGN